MNKISVYILGLFFAGISANLSATTDIDQSQLDAITTECKQEAKGAVYEDIYAENCVEEKLQALKEQSGQGEKEKS